MTIVQNCTRIIDYIVQEPEQNSKMLTYASIARIVGAKDVDESVISAVALLSTRFDALIMHFILIDEDGELRYLADDEATSIIYSNFTDDQDGGQLSGDLDDKLLPYYEGNRANLVAEVKVD